MNVSVGSHPCGTLVPSHICLNSQVRSKHIFNSRDSAYSPCPNNLYLSYTFCSGMKLLQNMPRFLIQQLEQIRAYPLHTDTLDITSTYISACSCFSKLWTNVICQLLLYYFRDQWTNWLKFSSSYSNRLCVSQLLRTNQYETRTLTTGPIQVVLLGSKYHTRFSPQECHTGRITKRFLIMFRGKRWWLLLLAFESLQLKAIWNVFFLPDLLVKAFTTRGRNSHMVCMYGLIILLI